MTQEERQQRYPALTAMCAKMDESFEVLKQVHQQNNYVCTLEQTVHSLTGKLGEARQEISELKKK